MSIRRRYLTPWIGPSLCVFLLQTWRVLCTSATLWPSLWKTLWFDGNYRKYRESDSEFVDVTVNILICNPSGEGCKATECCGSLDVTMQVLQHRYDDFLSPSSSFMTVWVLKVRLTCFLKQCSHAHVWVKSCWLQFKSRKPTACLASSTLESHLVVSVNVEQAVVERKLLREQRKRRHDFTRQEFLQQVWKWKNEWVFAFTASFFHLLF